MKPEYLLILEKTFDDPRLKPWVALPNLLRAWDELVSEFERGYTWCMAEYDNDMYVRWSIDRILNLESVQAYPEIIEFRQQVEVIDERFRNLASPHKREKSGKWWDQVILRYAGEEYAIDAQGLYDVEIEIVPEGGMR